MFERPDADYLQDLLAGYVLGTLDRVERHYLEEQMARDPKLQRILYQLEHALEAVEKPTSAYSDRIPAISLPPPTRRSIRPLPPERRRAKWIVILSALMAVGIVSVGLPWLRARYSLTEWVSDWIPGQADEIQPDMTAWAGIGLLLEDHNRIQQSAQAEVGLDQAKLEETYATLDQVFAEADSIQVLNDPNAQLLRGSRYEQPHLQGLRLAYRLGSADPVTADRVVLIYQLKPQDDYALWLPGQVFIEAENGTNLLLWRSPTTIYAIAAQLPIEELRSHANNLAPL
ncbi:MAG: hypothetical protein AAFY78_20860 [Cyanobacteria bacterium J06648_16]